MLDYVKCLLCRYLLWRLQSHFVGVRYLVSGCAVKKSVTNIRCCERQSGKAGPVKTAFTDPSVSVTKEKLCWGYSAAQCELG